MEESDKLKKEIAERTVALNAKVDDLRAQAKEIIDPLSHIQDHPYLALGISVGAGLIVGSQLYRSRKILEPVAVSLFTSLAGELIKKYSFEREARPVTSPDSE